MQREAKFQGIVKSDGEVAFFEHCSGLARSWGRADDHLLDIEAVLDLIRASEHAPIPPCFINVSLASAIGFNGQRILRMIRGLQGSRDGVVGVEVTEHGVHMGHTADVGRFIRLARDQGLFVALDGVEAEHPFSHHSLAWRAGITHVKIRASEAGFERLASDFHQRGIRVVAKHIERPEQLLKARRSADLFQGYLIARPMSMGTLLEGHDESGKGLLSRPFGGDCSGASSQGWAGFVPMPS